MKKASSFISQADREAVAAAVAEAEKNTSAEIVPVVATASGRYDRAEDIVGVLTALIALTAAWLLFQDIGAADRVWTNVPSLALGLVPCLLIIIVGFMAGSALATYVPALRLPFIPRREMLEEVERRAHATFALERVRHTEAGGGVLIYISLYERLVRVIPDDAVAKVIKDEDWEAVKDLVIDGLRRGQPADGLVQAIAHCGTVLKEPFPIQPGDENELANELRILD